MGCAAHAPRYRSSSSVGSLAGQHLAQERHALSSVENWPFPLWWYVTTEIDVLLEHVPPPILISLELLDGSRHRSVTPPQRTEQATAYGVDERNVAATDLLGEIEADVFEMGVDDTPSGVGCERRRVVSADEQVPGVEAPLDRRSIQHRAHITACLDERADVRVKGVKQTVVLSLIHI